MKATWKGPGSFSTSSGAITAGQQFDAANVPADYLAELVATGRVALDVAPHAPEKTIAPAAPVDSTTPPPQAEPIVPEPQAATFEPKQAEPAPEAKPEKRGGWKKSKR